MEALGSPLHKHLYVLLNQSLIVVQANPNLRKASQSPALLIIAGRTPSKVQECIDALKKEYPNTGYRALQLDLSSQKAVRTAAAELLSWTDVPKLDIIVNNAAVMVIPERTLTEDGIELQFGTNHIGHFLFTNLIMPKILAAAASNPKGATRVVNVSSFSPTWSTMRWSDLNQYKINKTLPSDEQPPYNVHRDWGVKDPENASYLPLEGYNQSKVANVLFSVALNNRLYDQHGILSFALHPGVIKTELVRYAEGAIKAVIDGVEDNKDFFFKSLGQGSSTTLVAALDPKLTKPEGGLVEGKENHGVYLIDCQVSGMAKKGAVGSGEAERLWGLSEGLVGEKFEF